MGLNRYKDDDFSPDEVLRAFDFANLEEGRGNPLHFNDSHIVLREAKLGRGKFARVWKAILPNIQRRKLQKLSREVIDIRKN